MQLRIVTPTTIALDGEVLRIVAEAPNGAFGLLPRHVDFVTQLVPGILTWEDETGEHTAGIGAGTLVKRGSEVRIATGSAILDDDLEALTRRLDETIRSEDEAERAARTALARLEAEMLRRLIGQERPAA